MKDFNPEEIMKLPDNSVQDPAVIREIAKYCIENRGSDLHRKVDKTFAFCGLYPYDIRLINIIPDKLTMK